MNIAIAVKGKDEIVFFIRNCIKKGKDFVGDRKIFGLKSEIYDIKWTIDETNPVFSPEGIQIGWDKTFSQLNETSQPGTEIEKTLDGEIPQLYEKIVEISKMNFTQIDTHVDNIFSQLSIQQKNSLKLLYKTVLGLVRLELK